MFFARAPVYIRPFSLQKRSLASVTSEFHIPVIKFSKFRTAKLDAEKKETANEILSGFKNSGFIYISDHGIPADTISSVFRKSTKFFKLPDAVKSQLAWEDPRSNRGYVGIGRERSTQSTDPQEILALREKAPDCKQSMEIGRDWDSEWKNKWPKESDVPEFKQTMLEFFQTCHSLHVELMRSIALGLDLSESFFDHKIDQQCHNLRLVSYPPMKRVSLEREGQARGGTHSDYGTLTLLFQVSQSFFTHVQQVTQDSVGGLEVMNAHTGTFIPVTPIPGTIVINVGDLLARWSNDVLRSTLHRVVAPPSRTVTPAEAIAPLRQSIVFFSNPNFDAEIACLPNCGTEAKYPPINTQAYIVGRLASTYV